MALQCQTLSFSVSADQAYSGNQTAIFQCNSITNNKAWVAIQSINVSYDNGEHNHEASIRKCLPSVQSVNGNQVNVNLNFLYCNEDQNDIMSGTVEVLVLADVS
ncbi:hypothetical protein GCM10009122_35520 [Fulvivirga kasyanovii]|uniref:Uncharacterized protein n=1 Tax=Fulvivirga kasyanovii TaxID=396812 RepID=A0ABW9RMK4_9BACT|nr:hypothetical protein [Fulvivirga kasyanovii]MTI25032.1 hypothetical protein [Fulvivirga kasyanovii]